ncbi:uncharacterized protein LOC133737404 [Rosa rugosa]|uniref:uncharacterized protein LOC133737404 n=1 Tax=Rosa rugosa TaxID=74645 RepID=UPI002B410ABA|nr:uncharacterized protein LOC133737404 [Rosa rugosa]
MPPRPDPRMAAVLRAFEALGNASEQTPEELERYRVTQCLEQFTKLKPPQFNGIGEACEAENWLKQIHKILEILRTPEQYRVSLAVHQLVGEADNWWDTVRSLRTVADLTWAEFEQLFLERFFPPVLKAQKISEFFALTQGNKTTHEYVVAFTRLLKYVPAIANDDQMKKQRFMAGLRDSIRRELRSDTTLSYSESVAAAYAIEADEAAYPRRGDGQGSSHPRKNRWVHRRKLRGGNPQGYTSSSSSSGSSGRRGTAPYTCFACGQPGHTKARCPLVNNSQGASSSSGFQNPRPAQSLSTQISPAPYRPPNPTQQQQIEEETVEDAIKEDVDNCMQLPVGRLLRLLALAPH